MPQQDRNRKDHLLPQGYLEGFTAPDGYLEVFDIPQKRWFRSKPEGVAAIRGYFDYSPDAKPDETADQAFREFEDDFPNLRRELIATNFRDWKSHLDFLLRYMQMIRVRTQLFRKDTVQQLEKQPPRRFGRAEVIPHPSLPGQQATRITLEEFDKTGEERNVAFNDLSISQMRAELKRGVQYLGDFNWVLRYTTDPAHPLITADEAIRFEGPALTRDEAIFHPDSWFLFPICWQACLIGNRGRLWPKREEMAPENVREQQQKFLGSLCRFSYSPIRLRKT